MFVTFVVDIWNELKAKYLRSDEPWVFHLDKLLSCINQGLYLLLNILKHLKLFETNILATAISNMYMWQDGNLHWWTFYLFTN